MTKHPFPQVPGFSAEEVVSKIGFCEQLKGGVIMDVIDADQARIAEEAGACAVMALERVPADIRKFGGVARASDPEMIAAIQRIFLDPSTSTYTEKRVLGQAIGAAWTNGSPAKTIGICEGFETAAAYTSLTGIQAWATMGAKRFHQVDIPASVETLILLADNDAEGRRARDRAAEAYRRPGLAIETEWPPGRMNDWAQLLKR